jgi:hypothetical protein
MEKHWQSTFTYLNYLERSFWHFSVPFMPVSSVYAIPYPLMFFFLFSAFIFHTLSKEKQNLTPGTTLPQTGKRKRAVWYKFFVGMFLLDLVIMFVESTLYSPCRYGEGWCLDFGPIFGAALFFMFIVLPGTFIIMLVEYFRKYWKNRSSNNSSSGAGISAY